jgi:hypothetical protein
VEQDAKTLSEKITRLFEKRRTKNFCDFDAGKFSTLEKVKKVFCGAFFQKSDRFAA